MKTEQTTSTNDTLESFASTGNEEVSTLVYQEDFFENAQLVSAGYYAGVGVLFVLFCLSLLLLSVLVKNCKSWVLKVNTFCFVGLIPLVLLVAIINSLQVSGDQIKQIEASISRAVCAELNIKDHVECQ